jgi:hypothetical protein
MRQEYPHDSDRKLTLQRRTSASTATLRGPLCQKVCSVVARSARGVQQVGLPSTELRSFTRLMLPGYTVDQLRRL